MRTHGVFVAGIALALALVAAPAGAQTHVDIGVLSPHVAARVVIGSPGVVVGDPYCCSEGYYGPEPYYDAPRYYEPASYGRRDRSWRDERARDHAKRERERYKDMREARREYWKDRREAEREYRKDVREARREYEKDRREADREYWKDRREGKRGRH